MLQFFSANAPLPKIDREDAIVCRLDMGDYQCMTCREDGLFTLRISQKYDFWRFALMDFLDFYRDFPSPILVFADDGQLKDARAVYEGHSHDERRLRPYEPRVLVHSTDPVGWAGIQSSQALLSFHAQARKEEPIGRELGDPADFSRYVMFSNPGQLAGEIVVSSRQSGFINMDVNAPYSPGARLYFDAASIARDGLLLRDGAHLKVRDRLSLEPYLLFAATPETFHLMDGRSTPAAFAAMADAAFQEAFPLYK